MTHAEFRRVVVAGASISSCLAYDRPSNYVVLSKILLFCQSPTPVVPWEIVTGGQNRSVASAKSRAVTRIGVDDPRMSKIVIYNGTVYISGQADTIASDSTCAKSDLLGKPLSSFLTHLSHLFCSLIVKGQTENVLAKVDDLLNQAGTSKSDLLTANIWLKEIDSDFKEMNAVWNDWLDPNNKPVRATVQARMARPEILVEIQVTAKSYM
jgi:enamine deaminase RidA (YjgF/YER057c/UK114 family)